MPRICTLTLRTRQSGQGENPGLVFMIAETQRREFEEERFFRLQRFQQEEMTILLMLDL